MKKVVIVGCGFAGLSAAKILGQYVDVDVTIIDSRNHHLFQPLLYQVATGELDPSHIAAPIRSILSKYDNIKVLKDTAVDVDLDKKILLTVNGEFKYDYLLVACGAKHSYFGNDAWEEFAPGLKSIEGALEIKNRIFEAFEVAESTDDLKIRAKNLSFVVVGGGATGVELAGAIADLSKFILRKDFSKINTAETKIFLVEGEKRILSAFSEKTSKKAEQFFKKMGVELVLGKHVTSIDKDGVMIGNTRIEAATVLWGAGVKAQNFIKSEKVEIDRAGRVAVEKDLSLKNYPEVFVAGDGSLAKNRHDKPYPGVATVALQQGRMAGINILRSVTGRKTFKFFYMNRGKAATIGKGKAVMEIWGYRTAGFKAWMVWLAIHVIFLNGMRNRLFVLLQWVSFYLLRKGDARIILERDWRMFAKKETQNVVSK